MKLESVRSPLPWRTAQEVLVLLWFAELAAGCVAQPTREDGDLADPDPPDAEVMECGVPCPGSPCRKDGDCPGGRCLTEQDGYPAGYCVLEGCSPEGAACGEGSGVCVEALCLGLCGSGKTCRTGYVCREQAGCSYCSPGCTGNHECSGRTVCDPLARLCLPPPCRLHSDCLATELCSQGRCRASLAGEPPGAPGPDCTDLPEVTCPDDLQPCGVIEPFSPPEGRGYINDPENGRSHEDTERSHLRRDFQQVVRRAAAFVDCKLGSWPSGNGGPLGLGDMSLAGGLAPEQLPGHPAQPPGTHLGGLDLDVAYYQTGTLDNDLRPVCNHFAGDCSDGAQCASGICSAGQCEVFRCTGEPNLLDPWRTALFVGALFETPGLRVVGMDGQTGPLVRAALDRLCEQGWLDPAACARVVLDYEPVDEGRGWHIGHHDNVHLGWSLPGYRHLHPRGGESPAPHNARPAP